jgi:hypothetical protein
VSGEFNSHIQVGYLVLSLLATTHTLSTLQTHSSGEDIWKCPRIYFSFLQEMTILKLSEFKIWER